MVGGEREFRWAGRKFRGADLWAHSRCSQTPELITEKLKGQVRGNARRKKDIAKDGGGGVWVGELG